jgi:xanthine dehydrogenase accessory factor
MTTPREQSWSDDAPDHGRLLVLSRNPVSEAVAAIATAVGKPLVLVEHDEDGAGLAAYQQAAPTAQDAVLVCDHDAPDAPKVLRAALDGAVGYVAMLASRSRTARVLAELRGEGYDEEMLSRLHMPAGLDTGGKTPGEMALSVVAEVVAWSHGRTGGPMSARHQDHP